MPVAHIAQDVDRTTVTKAIRAAIERYRESLTSRGFDIGLAGQLRLESYLREKWADRTVLVDFSFTFKELDRALK